MSRSSSPKCQLHLDSTAVDQLATSLDADGFARLPALLNPAQCLTVSSMFADERLFRSRVVMARHGYGQGEYRYFSYPLPELIQRLRTGLYAALAPIANAWNASLGIEARYPLELGAFLARCHEAGQTRPTPLVLRYGEGDYNRLHQDLYGEHAFPLQVAVLLSAPEQDFAGGELVLTEQRARMQTRPHVVPLRQGDAVAFSVSRRPLRSARGISRATMRHGVSTVRWGERYTLGLIFHDAT